MLERREFLGIIRDVTAAAAMIPFSVSAGHAYQEQVKTSGTETIAQQEISDRSFLDQFDQYLETDYGKAIAGSLFIFSLASSAYRLQKSWEQDSRRKFAEAVASSAFLVSLSLNFLTQTQTDVDPKITTALIDVFSVLNSTYMIESALEADRQWGKKLSSLTAAASLVVLSSVISLDTLNNS